MRLGIVSDTHGHLANTTVAVRMLTDEAVDAVIHCGDIGSPHVVPLFAGRPAHFVFGNVDHDVEELRWAIEEAGQTCHERFGRLKLGGRRIAFAHGDEPWLLSEAIESQDYDLVCYGHTHKRESHREGRTLVLNPGALYRANPKTLALVTLPEIEVRCVEVP